MKLNTKNLESMLDEVDKNINSIHSILTDNNFTIDQAKFVDKKISDSADTINVIYNILKNNINNNSKLSWLYRILITFIAFFGLLSLFNYNSIFGYFGIGVWLLISNKVFKKIDSIFSPNLDYYDKKATKLLRTLETQDHNYKRKTITLCKINYDDFKRSSESQKEDILTNNVLPAVGIITNYIDGYDVNLDELSPNIKEAMKDILLSDLNISDNNYNLRDLLNIVKEKNLNDKYRLERISK